MKQANAVKLVGLAGMVWAGTVLCLGVLVTASKGGSIDPRFVALTLALGLLFWRLYGLHRWAAVGACLYCGFMAAQSGLAGIWQWSALWIAAAVALPALVALCWKTLRSGI